MTKKQISARLNADIKKAGGTISWASRVLSPENVALMPGDPRYSNADKVIAALKEMGYEVGEKRGLGYDISHPYFFEK